MIQFANKSDLDFKELNANFNFLGAKDPGFCFLEIFCMNGLQNAAHFGESPYGSEFCIFAISLSFHRTIWKPSPNRLTNS